MRNEMDNRYQGLFTAKTFIIFIYSMVLLLLAGCGQMPTEDLTNLTLPSSPNYYLMCPPNYCNVTPNDITPVYNISADDLFNAWNQLMSQQRNIEVLGSVPSKGQVDYVQQSIFGFPERITVQFIALSDTTSTLAVYSQSIYGFYDFGANKNRLQNWIAQLNQIVSNMPPTTLNANEGENNENPEDTTDEKNALTNSILNGITTPTSTDNGTDTSTDNSGASSTDNGTGTSTDNSGTTSTDNGTGTSTDNSGATSTDTGTGTGTSTDNSSGMSTTNTATDNGASGSVNTPTTTDNSNNTSGTSS